MAQKGLAVVNEINGICVFTDCKPVSEYEVIGTVSFSTKEGYKNSVMNINGVIVPITYDAQYTAIRSALIMKAVLANRDVEGIILQVEKEGEGFATMIKFKEGTEHKHHAMVNRHEGLYIFTDCSPVSEYKYLGKKKLGVAISSAYVSLRNDLIKKCWRKYKKLGVEGVIITLVDGGYDMAEAIKFE